jgi:hypothetical protein
MPAMNTPCERLVRAYYVVLAALTSRHIADKVLACGQVDGRLIAQDKTQRKVSLRRDAVPIGPFVGGAAKRAGSGVPDAEEKCPLQRQR